MILYHLYALTFAFLLDRLIGDPPSWPHPVKWMGSLIGRLDKALNKGKYRKMKGMLMLVLVLGIVLIAAALSVHLVYLLHPAAGVIWEGLIIASTIAQKSLEEAGDDVYSPLSRGDMKEARKKLSYIVGRDTDSLGESEIVRGTVETVAENTSDGITAPLFWAAIGGAPLAMLYRAVNTCDSMVGYKNERYQDFGWASAKMDDFLNWIPSRLTGFLMLIGHHSEHHPKRSCWKILFRDAKKHPSPNSGWCEAGVAALLGVQLGGRNVYKGIVSNRALMGEEIVPLKADHIHKTIKIMHRTAFLFLLVLWLGGMIFAITDTWI